MPLCSDNVLRIPKSGSGGLTLRQLFNDKISRLYIGGEKQLTDMVGRTDGRTDGNA